MIYVPIAVIGYYYATYEYLVLYSNGKIIKININKIAKYSELSDLLKKLL